MFRYESEMIPVIRANLAKVLGWPGEFAWACELPVCKRVVDVVAAPIDRRGFEAVYETARLLTRLNMAQMKFLSFFTHGMPVSVHSLCQYTFTDATQVHQFFITPCSKLGLIRRQSRYTYKSSEWTRALPPYIVAIEAKLTRRQDVLKQACDNFVFADVSFAALDQRCLSGCRRCLQDFGDAGVGVLGVHPQDIEVLIRPCHPSVEGPERGLQMIRLLRDLSGSYRNPKWKFGYWEGC